jgi:hypothetical protein
VELIWLRVALAKSSLTEEIGGTGEGRSHGGRDAFGGAVGEPPKECSNVHCVASSASAGATDIVNAFTTGGVV